jgi:hypothetical protein
MQQKIDEKIWNSNIENVISKNGMKKESMNSRYLIRIILLLTLLLLIHPDDHGT